MSKQIHGFICGPKIYRYRGVQWEQSMGGFGFHKKDGELYVNVPKRCWAVYDAWRKLAPSKQARCRIGGGCREF